MAVAAAILAWVKTRPIVSFFALTLLLTWVLVFPGLVLIDSTDQPLLQVLLLYGVRLGVYVPVLVGLLITRWIRPERSPAPARTRWLTFGVVWIVAFVVYVLDLRGLVSVNVLGWVPLLLISIPIAMLPAFVVSSAFGRVTSIREYLSTLVHPRGHIIWYLVALLTLPVLSILGLGITQLLTGEPWLSSVQLSPGILLATLVTFASVFFYSGGINEEGGWRGFAQRRLQAKFSPLVTNLLLWAYLVVWHIPQDIIQFRDVEYLLVRFGLFPSIAILFGWVYNQTRGSILAPALFHASINSMNTLGTAIPLTLAGGVLLALFAIFAIFKDRMWKRIPTDHPAVYPVRDAA